MIFRLFKSIYFLLIEFYCNFSISYKILPLKIFTSVSWSYFILAVPMLECLGKHSCMCSLFPIAILNGTSFFLSLMQEKLSMPKGHCYRPCN